MSDKQVVLAIFPDEAAADAAVTSLKSWDKADGDIKLNAIGVLVLDKKGKVKTHKLGRRSVGKGAGIGVILAVFVPPSLLAGAVAGGVLGALHHKNLGLGGNDRDRLTADLANGKAAVGVLVAGGQATEVSGKLTELGGQTEVHTVSDEDIAEADKVAAEMAAAEADWDREHSAWMRVEEFQDAGQLVIRAELPGIDATTDVEVSLTRDTLQIRAERHEDPETTEKPGYRSEFRYGSFAREFVMPEGVSEDDIKASYHNGILEVRAVIPEGGMKTSSKVIQVMTA